MSGSVSFLVVESRRVSLKRQKACSRRSTRRPGDMFGDEEASKTVGSAGGHKRKRTSKSPEPNVRSFQPGEQHRSS